ncbi:MAG: hypothetical protein AAGA48_07750, partial [Myxococcota bacterium]
MMSETTVGRIEGELQDFPASSLTVRALQSLFSVLPGAEPLRWYPSLDAAAPSLEPGRAQAMREALASPAAEAVLDVAKAIDANDRSSTLLGGVQSVFMGLFGGGPSNRDPQRDDASFKARSLAYVMGRLADGGAASVVDRAPAQPLLQFYAVAEVAIPLGVAAADAGGSFVAQLVKGDRSADWTRLRTVVGADGVDLARRTLPTIVPILDHWVMEVLPHSAALTAQVESVVPSLAAGTDLAAAGLDALDAYRWLTARLLVELEIERQPRPIGTPMPRPVLPSPDITLVPSFDDEDPATDPEDGPASPFAYTAPKPSGASRPAPANPFADPAPVAGAVAANPLADPTPAEPSNPFADPAPVASAEPSNPFADPAPVASAEPSNPFADPAPVASAEPSNPFADPAPVASTEPSNPFADPAPVALAEPSNPFAEPAPAASAEPSNPFADPAPVGSAEPSNPFAEPAPAASAEPSNPFAEPASATSAEPSNPFADPAPAASAEPSNPFADPAPVALAEPSNPFADPAPVALAEPS